MTDAPVVDVVQVEAKPVVKSKMSWLAWVIIASGALLAAQDAILVIQGAGITVPAAIVGTVTALLGLTVQVLRVLTTQPVAMSLTPQVGEAPAPPWTPTVTGPPRGLRTAAKNVPPGARPRAPQDDDGA